MSSTIPTMIRNEKKTIVSILIQTKKAENKNVTLYKALMIR